MIKENKEELNLETEQSEEIGMQFDPAVPSREQILQFLREHSRQIGLDALSRHFNLQRDTAIAGLE